MIRFSYEHVFRAASPMVLLTAFTDPTHVAAQDRVGQVASREVIERRDAPESYYCDSRIVPSRQLPAFVRPLVRGGLEYTERLRWDRSTDTLVIEVRPAILGGRASVDARCQIVDHAPGEVRRIYSGTVTVEVALIGGRVERSIATEIGRALTVAAVTTQAWLDARAA
ncbi:MAG: DUF2505 family protein [Deltaproteobacteria bacterium]|nr:DUF2505 family protein [Deltaproteobacteria bacterium]